MKVLFAVSNEEISESIVKKYQKEYKQIISYKNVYYFNAILKELQKDKTYDRVVISEDLEAFTNTQYDQIDKFIFDKLDSISDEASNTKGNDIPIILICSDRRTKSEQMLIKLFGIGVYDAIIGNDRSVDEVCKLINRPRIKKEAKAYYQIDVEEVNYQAENENDVSEMEIQNIVAHYKRLGKNEDRYIESFDNIAAQYNDTQLRIISKFLPLNVRAVLEEKSPKYQKVMSFNNTISDDLRKSKNGKEDGPSQILLKSQDKDKILSRPVVIPSAVNMNGTKKLARQKPIQPTQTIQTNTYSPVQSTVQPSRIQQPNIQSSRIEQPDINGYSSMQSTVQPSRVKVEKNEVSNEKFDPIIEGFEDLEEDSEQPLQSMPQEVVQPVKRGRGRPRKTPIATSSQVVNQSQTTKRGRGRPRKNPIPEVQEETVLPGLEYQETEPKTDEDFLPGFEEVDTPQTSQMKEKAFLPDFDEVDTNTNQREEEAFLPGFDEIDTNTNQREEEAFLPGFDEVDTNTNQREEEFLPGFDEVNTQTTNQRDEEQFLPGFEDSLEEDNDMMLPGLGEQEMENRQPTMGQQTFSQTEAPISNHYESNVSYNNSINSNPYGNNAYGSNNRNTNITEENYEEIDLSNLLTPDKKIVTFVGTSKNGTSFIVNNVAELMSSMGINIAILDTTKNRNSYYIYTKNEEPLREIATHSIEGLAQGVARGINVKNNLTVYTSLPDENNTIEHVDKILETLLQNHSLILIDTDFNTPLGYFKKSQETYLVQSMDILTIQPLTAFLKELKMKNILDENKLRIVLNKVVKIRGIKDETIIGGMAFYNDPAMSFMTELFDRDRIKYVSIPFENETYVRYLEGVIECEISLRGYSKVFIQTLKELANMIYPVVTATPRNNRNYQPPSVQTNRGNNFSSNMNSTLDKMRGY